MGIFRQTHHIQQEKKLLVSNTWPRNDKRRERILDIMRHRSQQVFSSMWINNSNHTAMMVTGNSHWGKHHAYKFSAILTLLPLAYLWTAHKPSVVGPTLVCLVNLLSLWRKCEHEKLSSISPESFYKLEQDTRIDCVLVFASERTEYSLSWKDSLVESHCIGFRWHFYENLDFWVYVAMS